MAFRHVKTKSRWKSVQIDPNLFSKKDFEGFISFEELHDYEIVDNTSEKYSNDGKVHGKKRKNMEDSSITSPIAEKQVDVKKKKKLNKEKADIEHTGIPTEENEICKKTKIKNKKEKNLNQDAPQETTRQNKKKKKQKGAKKTVMDNPEQTGTLQPEVATDMSGWKDLFVPDLVLCGLADQGFTAPTPIQVLGLPPAIRDRMDIVGAAETGSGKTLAFGVPVLHRILEYRERWAVTLDDKETTIYDKDETASDDNASTESDDPEYDLDPDTDVLDNVPPVPAKAKKSSQLLALILTPTRELAIQVRDQIKTAAKHTDIQVAVIVGGMSSQKQERILKRFPEIVVATPGRLWELIQQGEPHLNTVEHVQCLVVDEADRMVEKGHFEELTQLLEMINANEQNKKKRQNFVFSATLTLVHNGPQRQILKKKKFKMTKEKKLDLLIDRIGVKDKHKVIDLSTKAGTADSLTEARIGCAKDEKDFYLYYILKQYPGRTLVFANSKDCVRRLVAVLNVLKVNPLPLHADMHQRQRLKNLDRFKSNKLGLLVATDVAARGLDIQDVQHVIHYQVPKTSENYVHRSGRTARAYKDGLSIMLVGPDDLQHYRRIIRTLNKDQDLPMFPTETNYMAGIKAQVSLAREIDKQQHKVEKRNAHNSWIERAANDMDIELDEDQLYDLGDSYSQAQAKQHLKRLQQQLSSLQKFPLLSHNFSGNYPTKMGKLVVPYMTDCSMKDAVSTVKQEQLGKKKNRSNMPKSKKKKRKHKGKSNII